MVKPLNSYVVCKIVTLRESGLSKKLKKSWALNLDRQFKQLISVFENELLCGEKTSRPARKAQQRRAKTNISKSGKRPKNNIRTSKSTANLFHRRRRILKKYGIVSSRKKDQLEQNTRLIRKRWCSSMVKKPLGFYPASIFHRK